MKTIDEAITHYEEKAKEMKEKAESNIIEITKEGVICLYDEKEYDDYLECTKKYEQLAEWLTELKAYKACPLMEQECYFCRADRCHNGGQKNDRE